MFKVSGYQYLNENVHEFVHEVSDVEFSEFVEEIAKCKIHMDGNAVISDQLRGLDVTCKLYALPEMYAVFSDLKLLDSLEFTNGDQEYYKMEYLKRNPDMGVDGIRLSEVQKGLDKPKLEDRMTDAKKRCGMSKNKKEKELEK